MEFTYRTAKSNRLAYDAELGRYVRETDEEVVTVEVPDPPDRGVFLRSLMPILGGGTSEQQVAAGAKRMYDIDRDYPGFDRSLRESAWDIALAGLTAMLADEVITEQEHDAILVAWADAHLPVPEA